MTTHSVTYMDTPVSSEAALDLLAAPLANWFRQRFGQPTPVQRLAWPAVCHGRVRRAESEHVLISAPTGTGKTLAALLPVLGDLLQPEEGDPHVRVIYLAPLKALVNDVARGLERLLAELAAFLPKGTRLPRLAVRTGDTTSTERRHQGDHPPDVLLTTPESLAVMLSMASSSALFAKVRWVVVDEVHALAGNKRGADLAVCLERLESCSPFRRLGLSATATPLPIVAGWLVGVPEARSCLIVRAPETPPPRLVLEPLPEGARFLTALVDRLVEELPRHRAVLVFANTRALTERLAWVLRRRLPQWDERIGVHHSALAAERRRDIEGRFKRGELRVVVSSTSLELGIDIGTVDLVVLVHPPGDVVRLLQRVGRAGHDPRGLRQGLVLTASASELLEAAVTAASGRAGQCEPLRLPSAPLDVLCQQILGMCCARSCPPDEMFALIRRAAPFAELSRRDFDDCLAYLRGLDQHGENWLPARLKEDGDCFRICDAQTARLIRRNLGSILAEPTVPVQLRQRGDPTSFDVDALEDDPPTVTIGEVDESFADRLQPGDRFLLDGRCLEFRDRHHEAAIVEQVVGRPRTPRWTSDGWPLSPELAQRLYVLRLQAAEALRDGLGALHSLLRDDYGLTGEAVEVLAAYFQQQECVSEIPDVTTLLIESVATDRAVEYYLHTPLNRPGNDALARVAVARLARDLGRSATSTIADLGFILRLRSALPDPAQTMRSLLCADGFAADLNAALSSSDMLRGRFARVAQTGFMLLRNPEGRRRRVGGTSWPQRQLFEQVRQHDPEFILLRQALREVQAEICDGASAEQYTARLPLLTVRCRMLSRPSPFASAWTQVEDGGMDPTQTPAEALAKLHAELTGGGADASAG